MSNFTILLVVTILAGTIRPAASQPGIATPVKLQRVLATSAEGAVVSLRGISPRFCPRISISQTFTGGKLIFSDSPESPASAGILYRDTNLPATVPTAANRIFVYHVNASPFGTMKFSVLIKNNGYSTGTLWVRRTGIAGPGANYMQVGEMAIYRWLRSSQGATRAVTAGQTMEFDTNFDSIEAGHGDLVNGIWDYSFDRPHSIIICALYSNSAPITTGSSLGVLPRDIHDRGTFAHCDKLCVLDAGATIDTAGGVQQFPIGGDGDEYVTGCDNTVFPPTVSKNNGNYGVLYTFKMNATSTDSRALALLVNPEGGAWCGAVNAAPGLLPGGVFVIPSNGRSVSNPYRAAIEGEYLPGSRKEIWLQFMPAGASSFPVFVLTVPFSRDY